MTPEMSRAFVANASKRIAVDSMVLKLSLSNEPPVFTFVAVDEALVGIAFLLGFLVRPASIGGIIMNAFFYLAAGFSSASTAGVNLVMIGGQFSMILLSTARVLGIDALFHKRFPRIPLW